MGLKSRFLLFFRVVQDFLTNHTPGSVSDIRIMANHIDVHKTMLKKSNQELLVKDNGEESNQFQKKQRNGELNTDELVRHGNVSSDRVLVENLSGRISHSTFKWNESSFDSFTRTCFALTSFHVKVKPLRSDDGPFYKSVMGRYASIAVGERTQCASTQRRYRVGVMLRI
ncbi:LOW QUALITY PROTEIN: hypothetical protein PHMEG_00037345 [Phytophthora megakarya]|uniref:Uncharacterized protein n=1 Tax=Phytophthora megakarya TaxID=4795 RepID=A0A225UJR7_9STRA|nr:LOW QUALITY PROTEIN: hypothetical protein PHMEG_00037345 [Phytophthora megakarya]